MAFDWQSVVKMVAPTLATALGGPLAGVAVKALGDALLGDSGASQEDIAQAIQGMKPEDLIKLKEADRAFALKMRELEIEQERIDQTDRASARGTWQVLIPTERGILFALAGIVVAGAFGAFWFILNPQSELPSDSNRLMLVGAVLGYASAALQQVLAFFFGSSSQSKSKTEALNQAVANLTSVPAPGGRR